MKTQTANAILRKSKQVFLSPAPCYAYRDIILGVQVAGPNGKKRHMRAVDSNSFVHYRFQGESSKILSLYQDYFIDNRLAILKKFRSTTTRTALDTLSDKIRKAIIKRYRTMDFRTNTDISSYNRTRKIIDLYFEHIIAMAEELGDFRKKLVPLLFLPLDSKMFSNPQIFTDQELRNAGVSRKASYGSLKTRRHYMYLQDVLIKKAETVGTSEAFYPIFFDLMWGAGKSTGCTVRYASWGNNLFETNWGAKG